MSTPMSTPTQRAIHAIAKTLIPLFLCDDTDRPAARAAALAALAAYHPDTLTDYLTAARAIAFSLGAVAATGIALDPELPPKQQLQTLTRANSFARLAQKAETALDKARQHRPPPHTPPHMPEPEPAIVAPTAAPQPTQPHRPDNATPPRATPAPSDIVSSAATPADAAINALLDRFMSACGQTPYGQTPRPGATATQKPA
ncbi:MAG TPA: hypothetical protein VE690_01185, partial [Rhodopila sp.]|nr:hypothetical protein [Rhodopila sp.]